MITETFMPKNGMDMTEGTIIRWLKEVGDRVEADEPIMEIETDKITMEAEAPGSGVLLKKLYEAGDTVPVLTVLGYIGEPGDPVPSAEEASSHAEGPVPPAEERCPAAAEKREASGIPATPHARRLAAEKGIRLSDVRPSGSEGQILASDVEKAAGVRKVAVHVTSRRISGMRRVIAKRMLESHTNVPTVTQNTRVDVTQLLDLRRSFNAGRENRVSVNDFVLRAVAIAARENERIRMQFAGTEYRLLDEVNTGVAVSTEDGVLVPVVRGADGMTLTQIAAETKRLAAAARENTLRPDELGDACITVSNLGMFGVHSFTPIINEPESAILGVCAPEEQLRMDGDGRISVHRMMMLCLTYDHRVLNGTEAALFSNRVKELLEDPDRLLP